MGAEFPGAGLFGIGRRGGGDRPGVVGAHAHREIELVRVAPVIGIRVAPVAGIRVAQVAGIRVAQVVGFRVAQVIGFRVIAAPNGLHRPSSRRLPAGPGPGSSHRPVARLFQCGVLH
jgi:hypothetical protein